MDWTDGELASLARQERHFNHKFALQQDVWKRTARTHFNGKQYSIFDEPSVVLRVEQRLQAADDKLEDAYTSWVASRREWTLLNTYKKLEKSARTRPQLEPFVKRATDRWLYHRNTTKAPKSKVNTYFEGQKGPNWKNAFAVHFGLAKTWGVDYYQL